VLTLCNQGETTLNYKKKYNVLLKFIFVVSNSLVVLSVFQIKNVMNLKEYDIP
jgi:hypothetical protein